MNIDKVLKELNKNVADEDQFKVASKQPEGYFVTERVSTGNPYLDYKIGGGIPMGRFTLMLGGEGSGKTSITLLAAANLQKEKGKYVVYFDAEGTVNDTYIERFNIDPNLFIHHKDKNLENMLNAAEAFSRSTDVGMIVVDSIPMFVSTVLEEKSAEDNTMAIDARKYNARMPIIYGNCTRRNIALVGINFYKKDPGAMGDPRILTRGEWQKYMSSLTIEFTKKNNNLIKDNSKSVIGVTLDTRVKKSKLHKADAKDDFQVNFYYDFGFDKFDDYASLFVELGIIERKGAWYYFPNQHKEQGLSKVAEFLENNPEYLEELRVMITEGVPEPQNEEE
jgi:recombination protein RecA